MDGTVYRGKEAVAGAAEAIAALRRLGKRIVFLSNRGNISRMMCHGKLTAMGVAASEEEIVLTSTVAAIYLKTYHANEKVWTLGDKGLRDELETMEVMLADRPETADWLLITLHESLTYKELNQAFRAVRHGAKIMATNADKSFPGDEGESIDVAGMIHAITATTGSKVELVVGKPSRLMAEAALLKLGLQPQDCMVVGDSLESDIRLGNQAGMRTALVLTGSVSRQEAKRSGIKPDYILDSIADLPGIVIAQQESRRSTS